MIELLVLNYLKEILEIPVLMERPADPEDIYILIEKTGSSRENFINNSTIAIQSYGKSLFEAASLNEVVKELMLGNGNGYENGIIALDEISKCELNSDYNATDTTTKKYRYQAVFDLVHF